MELLSVVAVLLAIGTISGNPIDKGGSTGDVGKTVFNTNVTAGHTFICDTVSDLNKQISCAIVEAPKDLNPLICKLIDELKCCLQKNENYIENLDIGKDDGHLLRKVIREINCDLDKILCVIKKLVENIVCGKDCDINEAIKQIQKFLCTLITSLKNLVKIVLETCIKTLVKKVYDTVKVVINALLCLLRSVFDFVKIVLCIAQKLLEKVVCIVIEGVIKVICTLTKGLTIIDSVISKVLNCLPGELEALVPCLCGIDDLIGGHIGDISILGNDSVLGGGDFLGVGELLGDGDGILL